MLEPKTWIIEKNTTDAEYSAIRNGADWTIEIETAKAYLFVANTDFGQIKMWCPKSQTIGELSESQTKKMVQKEAKYNLENVEEAIANATDYYKLDEITRFAISLANEKTIELVNLIETKREELREAGRKRWMA